jgi:hypothetical protein
MLVRSIIPTLLITFAGLASAQATAPTPEQAAPAADSTAASAPASAASDAEKTAAAAPKQRCHKEYRVGSNIPTTVCDKAAETQEERLMREHALDELKHAVKSGYSAVGN